MKPSPQDLSIPRPEVVTQCVPSEQLLAGRREVVIRHQGEDYRLRVTRQGKLLLTK
ncbi:MAG: hemin uptake protein HemP [Chromatiales bacterium]|nr:hemin uptake protein HemP [Chromatiales bacterium]